MAGPNALYVSSRLAVWRLDLGISNERIKPGHHERNGRHERIHLTLKKEATKPAAQNLLQQQARFDNVLDVYKRDRPHQALGKRKIDLGPAFAGRDVGIKEVADRIRVASFMHYDPGFVDHETCRVDSVVNPFQPEVLPMSLV